ncbi:hypothetical protein cand_021360 [Cryptosporidium andersoni]|uniref:Uncharacterized protein n=1 Tax=Cryptosporidium andersoni TaxID=117008 RepID=A0A1J4MSE3_9CRYT|nr:hypothetical protein cand_021360 [Cryptosporidium andersoni]
MAKGEKLMCDDITIWTSRCINETLDLGQIYNSNHQEDLKLIVSANGSCTLDIFKAFSSSERLYRQSWCPPIRSLDGDFDEKIISTTLYTDHFLCIGFYNGCVRLYSLKKHDANTEDMSQSSDLDSMEYYNKMFGNDTQIDENENKSKFWLYESSSTTFNSILLIKHVAQPCCIQAYEDMIYVIYDDGVIYKASLIEDNKNYNVIRYNKTFPGVSYFVVDPLGKYLAMSTHQRKLIIVSINNGTNSEVDYIDVILDIDLFKKTNYEFGKSKLKIFNIHKLSWSPNGNFLYIPGDNEIRVIQRDKWDVEKVKVNSINKSSKNTNADICLIDTVNFNEEIIIITIDLSGQITIYKHDNKHILSYIILDRFTMNIDNKKIYPISSCLNIQKSKGYLDHSNIVFNSENKDILQEGKLYISILCCGGYIYCYKWDIDLNPKIKITANLEDKYNEEILPYKEDYQKMTDSKYLDRKNNETLLWDDIFDKDDEDKEDENILKDNKSFHSYTQDITSETDFDIDDNYSNNDIESINNSSGLINDVKLLKKIIDKIKINLEKEKRQQDIVQPGSTKMDNNPLNNGKTECFYCWNQNGFIISSIDEDEKSILELECYTTLDGPRKIRLYDTKGYSMGTLGTDGYLLARKANLLENGTYIPSIIEYHLWTTWGRNDKSGWIKTMMNGEDIECITCGSNFIAVLTSLRFLRIWKNSGLSISTIKLTGAPVSCVSNENYLLVITQKEPFYPIRNNYNYYNKIINGLCNKYEIHYYDIDNEELLYSGEIALTPETHVFWCGISSKYIPVIQDTSGATFMLMNQWTNKKEWVPMTNFGLLQTSELRYYILFVSEEEYHIIKLRDGLKYPLPIMARNNQQRSVISTIPFNIPILGLPNTKKWLDIIENDKYLNHCVTNNDIPWEMLDELRLRRKYIKNSDLSPSLNSHDRSYKINQEKLLMRLYLKLLLKQQVESAFDIAQMLQFPKSLNIAMEQAEKYNERILATKINNIIQIKTSNIAKNDHYHNTRCIYNIENSNQQIIPGSRPSKEKFKYKELSKKNNISDLLHEKNYQEVSFKKILNSPKNQIISNIIEPNSIDKDHFSIMEDIIKKRKLQL